MEKKQKEWKESSVITKKLAGIGKTFQDLEEWIADNPQQATLIKTIAGTSFKRTCAIIKILAAAETEPEMSDDPSENEFEPTVEEMKMVTTDRMSEELSLEEENEDKTTKEKEPPERLQEALQNP